jgi:hypothetical protein
VQDQTIAPEWAFYRGYDAGGVLEGPAGSADGALSVIDRSAGHEVIDLGYDFTCNNCASGFNGAETGSVWWNKTSFTAGDVPIGSGAGAAVQVRAALALDETTVVIWRDQGTLYTARRDPATPASWPLGKQWAPPSTPLPNTSRTFAACVQRAGKATGYLLQYMPGQGFLFASTTDGVTWSEPMGPRDALGGAREIFLACGDKRVHAFAILHSNSNAIAAASWSPEGGWSEWADIVTDNHKRCFLSGFDRVTPDGTVGLLWTEGLTTMACDSDSLTDLYIAVAHVDDG